MVLDKKITTKLSLAITNFKVGEQQTDNPQVAKCGNLTINKIVKNSQGEVLSANDDSQNFVFTITLSADDAHIGLIEGTKIYGDVIFKNGVGIVSLKASESKTITGIPEGLSYSVIEREEDKYNTICETNNSGVINEETPQIVTYVNTEKNTESSGGQDEKFVDITIKKNVVGNFEKEENYEFEIALDNLKPNTTYTLSNSNNFKSDSEGKAYLTIYLAGGENAEFYNIPVGTTYKVTEQASNSIASYTVVDENNGTNIVRSTGSNEVSRKALGTEIETVNQGEEVTITFKNDTVNQEQDRVSTSLGVRKMVVKPDGNVAQNCEDEFEFEIKAENESYPMPEKRIVSVKGNGDVSFGNITFDTTGTYTYKINEKAGNSDFYKYDNIEYMVVYEVTNSDGLLSVSKSIMKNGFKSDGIVFVNTFVGNDDEEIKPDEPDNTDNADEPEKEREDSVSEGANKEENKLLSPQTGDNVIGVMIILVFVVVAFVLTNKKFK